MTVVGQARPRWWSYVGLLGYLLSRAGRQVRARWRLLPAFSARGEERRLRHTPPPPRHAPDRHANKPPGRAIPGGKRARRRRAHAPGPLPFRLPLPSRKPLNPHRVSVDATPRDHTCCVLHVARHRRRTPSRPRRWTEERSTDRPGSVHAPSG